MFSPMANKNFSFFLFPNLCFIRLWPTTQSSFYSSCTHGFIAIWLFAPFCWLCFFVHYLKRCKFVTLVIAIGLCVVMHILMSFRFIQSEIVCCVSQVLWATTQVASSEWYIMQLLWAVLICARHILHELYALKKSTLSSRSPVPFSLTSRERKQRE